MHVLIVGSSFLPSYGGPAFSASGLATCIANSGARVTVWAPDGSADCSPLLESASGHLGVSGSLRSVLDQLGPVDLIHDNGIWLPHNHRLAAHSWTSGIPRVVSIHGMLEPWSLGHKWMKKRAAWHLYQRRDLCRATRLHTTAEEERQHVERLNLGVPMDMVPNGVDLPSLSDLRQAPPDGEKRLALYLGRIHPIKGLALLLRAWSSVRPTNWSLTIAGPDEGGHRRTLEQIVRSCDLQECVRFLDLVAPDRRTELYDSASLFVLPTLSENFGISIAEALSHRIPVLTTTGAPWPQLELKGCGWRVAPDATAIATALKAATSCAPATLFEMGIKGRAYIAAEFSWVAVAQRMLAVYEQAVQSAGGRRSRAFNLAQSAG